MTKIAFDATQGAMRFYFVVMLGLANVVALSAETARAQETRARRKAVAPTEERPLDTFDLKQALVSEGAGWTADDAASAARGRAPQIAAARAAADSAQFDADATWTNFLPQLTLFAQYKRISQVNNNVDFAAGFQPLFDYLGNIVNQVNANLPADQQIGPPPPLSGGGSSFTSPNDNYLLGAGLVIPVSDIFLRVWPAYDAQTKSVRAREIQVEATEAQVMQQARDAFYTYARTLAFMLVQEQALKQAEAQAAQTKLFVDAGTAAPVDLMQATARLEGARSALARAQGMVEIARTVVATLAGVPRGQVTAIREPVTELPASLPQQEEQLISSGLTQRAEVRALREAVGATELAERSENNAALPGLFLEANDLYANPNPRYVPPEKEFHNTWEVSATLRWSPNQWLSANAKGNKQEAEQRKTRSDLAALEDAIRIEVVQANQDYRAATIAAQAAQAQLGAAEEAYRVRLATYRVGAGVMQDLIDADLMVTQARLQHINSVIDARASLARLKRAAALN